MVCIESMTTIRGDSRSTTSRTDSTLVSASRCTRSAATPSRRARSATCRIDSSPVTYSTPATSPARLPSTWSRSVELPDSGLTPHEHDGSGHEPAAEHPVELRHSGLDPGVRSEVHARRRHRPPRMPRRRPRAPAAGGLRDFLQ